MLKFSYVPGAVGALVLMLSGPLGPQAGEPLELTGPLTLVDTLGVSDRTTFPLAPSIGVSISSSFRVGPKFSTERGVLVREIGGFMNNCDVSSGVPYCPNTQPFVVEVRRSTSFGCEGTPECPDRTAAGLVGRFLLTHDDQPLIHSYEAATMYLYLEPGTYYALFQGQGSDRGFLVGAAQGYQAGTTTLGIINDEFGSFERLHRGAVRVAIGGTTVGSLQ